MIARRAACSFSILRNMDSAMSIVPARRSWRRDGSARSKLDTNAPSKSSRLRTPQIRYRRTQLSMTSTSRRSTSTRPSTTSSQSSRPMHPSKHAPAPAPGPITHLHCFAVPTSSREQAGAAHVRVSHAPARLRPVHVVPAQRDQLALAQAGHRDRHVQRRSRAPSSSSGTARISASTSDLRNRIDADTNRSIGNEHPFRSEMSAVTGSTLTRRPCLSPCPASAGRQRSGAATSSTSTHHRDDGRPSQASPASYHHASLIGSFAAIRSSRATIASMSSRGRRTPPT